jgi:flagellar hook assembly protein FlgD/lysophospholipase L1-like esterase
VAAALALAGALFAIVLAHAAASGSLVGGLSEDRYFSPNGDGQEDQIGVYFELSAAAHVSVVVRNAQGGRVRLLESNASHPAGGQYFTWDGHDDSGATVPDGVYTYKITAEGPGGSTASAEGKIGVDTRAPAHLVAPAEGASETGPFTVEVAPTSGITLTYLDTLAACPYTVDCQASGQAQPGGNWAAELDASHFYAGQNNLITQVGYTDAFGAQHYFQLPLTLIQVPREPQVESVSENRYFTPNEDGQDDRIGVGFSLTAPATTTITIADAGGQTVRTIEEGAQRSEGGQSFEWDGHDDGGATVPDGVYDYTITAKGAGGGTDSATGKIGVDTRVPAQLVSPAEGASLTGPFTVEVAPAPGITLKSLYAHAASCPVYFIECGASGEAGPGGDWTAELDASHFYAGQEQILTEVSWEDPFGGWHSYRLAPVTVQVPREPQVEVLTEDRYFSPNEDGQDDQAGAYFSLTAPATTTITIANAGGQTVRTIEDGAERPQGGQYFTWDGHDDSGATVPDGVYTYKITAEGSGGSTDSAEGKIGVDTRVPAHLAAPAEGASLTGPFTVEVAPTSGITLTYLYTRATSCPVYFIECGASGEAGPGGDWTAELDASHFYAGQDELLTEVGWEDPFGARHSFRLPTSMVQVLREPQVESLSEARYFSPNEDGQDDRIGVGFSLTAPATTTIKIADDHGQVVRTIEAGAERNQGGQAFEWDGDDDGGATVPDGVYAYTITAEGPGGATDSATGKIGIDTEPIGAITSPQPGDTLAAIAQLVYTPRPGRTIEGVSFCFSSTFECRTVYGANADGSWQTSRDTLQLSEGQTSVYADVYYKDAFGQPHYVRTAVPVTVDNTTPSVDLDIAPASGIAPLAVTGSIDAFQPREAELHYQLDFGDETPLQTGDIASPYEPVHFAHEFATVGAHRIRVVVSDGNGHSAERSTEVTVRSGGDETPPAVVFQGGPAGATRSTGALFTFRSTEAGSTFFCSLDGAAFAGCTSPSSAEGLAEGHHTFAVKARDAAGNLGLAATRGWTVDTTPPQTSIDHGLSGHTEDHSPSFSFSAGEPSSFRCSLDGATAVPCTSPKRYPALSEGPHIFTVTATDAAGNVDPTPALAEFIVDPPATPNHPPSFQLDTEATSGKAPLRLRAQLEATDPDGDPLEYEADYGDGSPIVRGPVSGAALEHVYGRPGTYVLDVRVSDERAVVERTATIVVAPDEPLSADPGDSRRAVVGEAISFDGGNSRPSGLVDGYSWNFGDGETATGQAPSHSWSTPGTYEVKLTVTGQGETATASTTVVVEAPPASGGLAVHVTGDEAPLEGATVAYISPDGSRLSATSDGSGTAHLNGMPDGASTIYVSRPGYRATAASAEVTGGQGSTTVDLAAGEMGASTLESKRLTYPEILEKGIDVGDPENSHVYEAKIHLFFVPDEPEPKTVTVIITPEGVECVGNCTGPAEEPGGGAGGGGGGTSGGGGGAITFGGDQYIPRVQYVGGEPVIQWLVLPIRASFLKEFFEVKMVIENLTTGIDFSPGSATLELPTGLSLAPTARRQSATQGVPLIHGGESRTVNWVVRGDTEGEYDLEASYSAQAPAVQETVYLRARTQEPLHVWGAEALKTRILVDEKATRWGPYAFDVEVRNVSDAPVYNMQVEMLDREPGASDEEAQFVYAPFPAQVQGTAEISPKGVWVAHYVVFPGLGNAEVNRLRVVLEKSFVERTGGDVDLKPELAIRSGESLGPNAGPVNVKVEQDEHGEDEAVLRWLRPAAPDGLHVLGYQISTRQSLQGGSWEPLVEVASRADGQESYSIPASGRAIGRYYAVGTIYSDHTVHYVHQIGVGPPRYVALGDSYSAGEGVPDFEPGTAKDVSAVPPFQKELIPYDNECHRSDRGSYAKRLVADSSLDANLEPAVFAACSGAVVKDLLASNPDNDGEPAQISHLSEFTDLVTLTIGGNDIGFRDIAAVCVTIDCNAYLQGLGAVGSTGWLNAFTNLWEGGFFFVGHLKSIVDAAGCASPAGLVEAFMCPYKLHKAYKAAKELLSYDPDRIANIRNLYSGTLGDRLLNGYLMIAAQAPNARVLIQEYPQITGGKANSNLCHLYGDLPDNLFTLGGAESDQLGAVITKLNDEIEKAANYANNTVEAEGRGKQFFTVAASRFGGHELCENGNINPGSFFNSLVIPFAAGNGYEPVTYSFHPNAQGQQAFADDLAPFIDQGLQAKVLTVKPQQTSGAGTAFVPFGARSVHADASWPGSTVMLSLVSPGGVVYGASSPGVRSGRTPTSEWLEIDNPEPGTWHVQVYGVQVKPEGEPTQISAYAEGPAAATPDVQLGSTPVAGAPETFDLTATGPEGTYTWAFSDGTTGTGKTIRHQFQGEGRRSAIVHVVTAAGGEGYFPLELGAPAVDHTPPMLAGVPTAIEVDAGAASGTAVEFHPAALDDVDGEVPVTCSPPSGSTFLVGTTKVECEATDTSGNKSKASFEVTVTGQPPEDTTPPDTRIDSGPAEGATASLPVSFSYSGVPADDVARFECRLDTAAFSPCPATGITYGSLDPGHHQFAVRAIDAAGNADQTPATRGFAIAASPTGHEEPTPTGGDEGTPAEHGQGGAATGVDGGSASSAPKAPAATSKRGPLCRKGFKKRTVHGKKKCVKAHRRHHRKA